jgi:hypothetical protein
LTLRELIIDWLTASRYVKWLEARHIESRQDHTERLAEKDAIIFNQRIEIAGLKLECDRMRLVLMPLGSPSGAIYADRFKGQPKPPVNGPVFEPVGDWAAELEAIYQKESSDGISGEGRQEVNKPGTDDGAQPQP